ncbi:MAG: pantetheine-phosphate adenylyltransferase [Acidobacteriota bacterium]|jgi:pantetheine-phosphate adenylyltransferase|nr:pantetheine-phosphate adenylyltransferase [Acidobacteriota bacterium]OQB52055.1 MAG: Phosphopantetheine adenylyltransferase [Candidatus Aminicenantes bacterium ADurb.Bin147]HNQ80975.1 pantetheine-phosphate adenylyltransferase [Candidatus Aminicenantes bacterium]MDD8029059.1 pantetheine-phosphate adenylyltransferase [Acidobacteriota bacterium]MDD8034109.1 pantetheine-phosphate adenylyltransferase [Acidobacteriota bacterium]
MGATDGEELAVYPGSFDPITNGHVDIIRRGAKLFPRILVAVLENPKKATLFSVEERMEIIREIFKDPPRIEVEAFHGLLADFTKLRGARAVIRGLRAVSDFEYEMQMALMNQQLNPELETLFMMPSARYTFLSSSLVKEVFALGGSVRELVPSIVEQKLREKFAADPESLSI